MSSNQAPSGGKTSESDKLTVDTDLGVDPKSWFTESTPTNDNEAAPLNDESLNNASEATGAKTAEGQEGTQSVPQSDLDAYRSGKWTSGPPPSASKKSDLQAYLRGTWRSGPTPSDSEERKNE